jgi:hypothetical protein
VSIKLGDTVKDTLTEFSGVVVAREQRLYASIRISIQPDRLEHGIPKDPVWLEECRCKKIKPKNKQKIGIRKDGPA